MNLVNSKGTFEVIPLSPGPLQHDTGTFDSSGEFGNFVVHGGLRLQIGHGSDALTGKQGTVALSQQVQHVNVVGGYFVDTGTWSFAGGTGAYVNLAGSDRFVAVALPSNRLLVRQKGIVRY